MSKKNLKIFKKNVSFSNFKIENEEDLTPKVLPTMLHKQKHAIKFFTNKVVNTTLKIIFPVCAVPVQRTGAGYSIGIRLRSEMEWGCSRKIWQQLYLRYQLYKSAAYTYARYHMDKQ